MHRVVIVGSGFGGLFAAKVLSRADVEVTVIDRTTHHVFQPLLYQVATGILSEGEIAPAIRDILRKQANVNVVLGEVTDLDLADRTVTSQVLDRETVTPYDSLIVAAGSRTSFFGHEFAEHAPGLKTIDDALELRGRIFGAFELAELETDPEARRRWLTFVVVGGGPTGVEMAGQIAELSRHTLKQNFRRIDPATDARIVLLDGGEMILAPFGKRLSDKARKELNRLGVEVHNHALVTGVDERGLDVESSDPSIRRIEAVTKVWAAGVAGSPLGELLAERSGVALARGGRVPVLPDCTLPGHPEVFVVGDLMELGDLPGVAEVAMQSGMHAAIQIERRLRGDTTPRRFKYRNLGDLASISRYYALAKLGPVGVGGLAGWLLWLVVHLTFLTGFKNRFTALLQWIITFFGRSRSQRTITMQQVMGRQALLEAARRDSGPSSL